MPLDTCAHGHSVPPSSADGFAVPCRWPIFKVRVGLLAVEYRVDARQHPDQAPQELSRQGFLSV